MWWEKVHAPADDGWADSKANVVEDHESGISAGEVGSCEACAKVGEANCVERPDKAAPNEQCSIERQAVTCGEGDQHSAERSRKTSCNQHITAVDSVG